MYDYLNDNKIGIIVSNQIKNYPMEAPYNPSIVYPEYQFNENHISNETNGVYESIRLLLYHLKMDEDNYGTPDWNPFKDIIKRGNKVFIKPNFVLDRHAKGGDINSVITHPSVIRAIIDYIYIALKGEGKIIIGDAPQADADFDRIYASELIEIKSLYKKNKNCEIEVIDLRQLKFIYNNGLLVSESRISLDGDPMGYTIFDIGNDSEFSSLKNFAKLYGADYDRSETKKHHNNSRNEYCIAKSVLSADVVISVPKMKTHRKAGVTLNFKNLIGINGNKNYLPHFQIGSSADGGDEFQQLNNQQKTVFYSQRFFIDLLLSNPNRVKESIYKTISNAYKIIRPLFFKKVNKNNVKGGGSWYGNDTIWRTILDLNKIFIYGDQYGKMHETPQRKNFCVVDGIIAGEGDGPLVPHSKICNLIAGGINLFLVDYVLVHMMGFDINKIPQYTNAINIQKYKLINTIPDNINICSNIKEYENYFKNNINRLYSFEPPPYWSGHIEL